MPKNNFENFERVLQKTTRSTENLGKREENLSLKLRDVGAALDDFTSKLKAGKSRVDQGGSSGGGGGDSGAAQSLGDVGGLASSIGAQMRSAFAEGIQPLTTLSTKFNAQFNAVGGTITALARRIDGAMKAPGLDAFYAKVKNKMPGAFSKMAVSGVQSFFKITGSIQNMGDVAGKPLDKIDKRLGKIAQTATKIPAGLNAMGSAASTAIEPVRAFGKELLVAAGVFGLAYKVVGFFKAGVQGASDLNETVDKSKIVLGDAYGGVEKFASGMSKEFGISKRVLLDTASSLGSIGKGIGGLSGKGLEDFTIQTTKLAADFSSLANIDVADAAKALQVGLSGEQSDALKQVGVILNETTVKQYAYSHGIAKANAELSEQEKFSARVGLINEKLADSNDNLAQTADSTANQFRKAGGGLENFGVMIGQALLPAVDAGTTAFNELLATVIETFENNRSTIESWGESLKSVMENVSFGIRNAAGFFEILKIKTMETAINMLNSIETLPENFSRVFGWLGRNWLNLLKDFVNLFLTFSTNLATNAKNLGSAVWSALQGKGFNFKFTPFLEGFKAMTEKLPDLLEPATFSMQSQIEDVWGGIEAKEAKRAATLAKAVPKSTPKAAEESKVAAASTAVESKFADLAEIGSKEAYSAILKANGQGKDKPMVDVAKTAKEQLAESKKQTAKLDAIAGKAGPQVNFRMA